MSSLKIGKKELIWIAIIIVALAIGFLKPLPGASANANYVLALILFAVSAWILRPFNIPNSVPALLMFACLLFLGVPYATCLTGFYGSSFWIMLAGMYFGFVLSKTGLARRIAYLILKIFPATYLGVILATCVIVVLFSFLTPSIMVRIVLIAPIVFSLAECAKVPRKSNLSAGLILTFFAVNLLIGAGWFTGSLWGPMIYGLAPAVAKPYLSPSTWSNTMFVPMEIMAALVLVVFAFIVFRTKTKLECTKQTLADEYTKLGPWTKDQKITLLVLVGAVFGWLAPTLGIANLDSSAVGLTAVFVLFIFRLIAVQDISTGVSWDFLLWVGLILSFPSIFTYTGFGPWIGTYLQALFLPLAGNLMILLLVTGVFMVLMRFWDVASGLTTIAMLGTLVPSLMALGINPACFYYVTIILGLDTFVLPYTQPGLIVADNLSKNELLTTGSCIKAGVIYVVLGLVAVVIASLYWQATGIAFITPP